MCLIVKLSYYHSAVFIFQDYDFCIFVINGKRHLRAVLGSPSFIASFVIQKVSLWGRNSWLMQPQSAYVAFNLFMVLLKNENVL